MSEAEGDGETPCCETFEPHMWKKNQCKNCFHTLAEHEDLAVELDAKAQEAEKVDEVKKAKEKAAEEKTTLLGKAGKTGGISDRFSVSDKKQALNIPPKTKGPLVGRLAGNKFMSKDETKAKAEKEKEEEVRKKKEEEDKQKHSDEPEEIDKQPTSLGAEVSVMDLARSRFGPSKKKIPPSEPVKAAEPPSPEPKKKDPPGPAPKSDGKGKFASKFGGVAKKEEPKAPPPEEKKPEPKPEPKKDPRFGALANKFNKPEPAKPAELEPKKLGTAVGKFGKPAETKTAVQETAPSLEELSKLKIKLKETEDKCKQLATEKAVVEQKLAADNDAMAKQMRDMQNKLASLETRCTKVETENKTLLDKAKNQKNDNLDNSEKEVRFLRTENDTLRDEINDMREEMDEMYDSFREKEMDEISDLQRELEQTAKNCRVLQFKLRKEERRAEQAEKDKSEFEERLHNLQNQFTDDDAKGHIKSLEDELKMAKDVSVRLHEEIDILEDKKCKTEEENRHLTELLEKADKKQFRLEMEIDKLHDKIVDLKEENGDTSSDRKVYAFQL